MRLYRTLIVVFLILSAAPLVSAENINDMNSFFNFDGNLNDYTGNFTAVDTGPDPVTYVSGLVNQSAELGSGGGTSRINLSNNIIDYNNDFSVSIAANLDSLSGRVIDMRESGDFILGLGRGGSDDYGFYVNGQDFNFSEATTGIWNIFILTYDSSTNDWEIYMDDPVTPVLEATQATGTVSAGNHLGADSNLNQKIDGKLDIFGTWDFVLNEYQRQEIMNSGAGRQPPFSSQPNNITFTANINNFTVDVENFGNYSTTTGSVTTDINATNVTLNFTYWNATGTDNRPYFNFTDTEQFNESFRSYNANLTPRFKVQSFNFYNYTKNGTINYTRNLGINLTAICDSRENNSLYVLYDNTSQKYPLSCTNSSQNYNFNFQTENEGNYNITTLVNTTLGFSNTTASQNFTFDLNDPSVYFNFTIEGSGFNQTQANVTLRCTDTIAQQLTYNITYNSNTLLNADFNNNTNQSALGNNTDGSNTAIGTCSDLFSSNSKTVTKEIYQKTLVLIDERDKGPFDVSNTSSARVYFDDNSSFFDFKSQSTNNVSFATLDQNKLRFELVYNQNVYAGGDTIIRYIDIGTTPEQEIKVCANTADVTHFVQFIISASEKASVIKNQFSNCYAAADYTRFAYQDGLLLKAYTIESQYYLNTLENNQQTTLASLDGSVESTINLDTLEFNANKQPISVFDSTLSFEKTGNQTVRIDYNNPQQNNEDIEVTITRVDNTSQEFFSDDFANPNNFTIYWDFSTLYNVTNTTLFKIDATATLEDGSSNTVTQYFNTQGGSGPISRTFAIVFSILTTLFGLTVSVARNALSWLGAATQIIALAVLTFAASAWYIVFLQTVQVILLVYIVIVMVMQTGEVTIA